MITIGIDPIAITIGPVDIRWYGIFIVLAVIAVLLWTIRETKRGATLSYDTIFTAALVGIPSGLVISRLFHVIDRWGYYSQNPGQIIGSSGLTIYGAVLGAALAIWIYSKASKTQFGYMADLMAPGIALAQAIGRIGCTINGCCYGLPTSLPWGIVYTNPATHAPLGLQVHPTQIYELIFCLIIFGILLRLKGRFTPNGSLFLIYLSLYSLWRFGIDFLREGTPFLPGLHQAQVIALVALATTISLLAYKTRWAKAEG
jgi:phosphatidylglycerol:prolipoprotein diacylglycerol transferase